MFPLAFIICHGYELFLRFILSSIFLHNSKSHAAESPLIWNNLKLKRKHWQYQRNILWKEMHSVKWMCRNQINFLNIFLYCQSICYKSIIFSVYHNVWFNLMFVKYIYSFWYVGQKLNRFITFYRNEKDAIVTFPNPKVLSRFWNMLWQPCVPKVYMRHRYKKN